VNLQTDAFEDRIEIDIDILEATPLSAESPPEHHGAYPFPFLTTTGNRQRVAFRALGLENQYLRVLVLPDLGGRIVSIFDKRTQTEALSQSFSVATGSLRGIALLQGVEFSLFPERKNAMGPVDAMIADDEDGPQIVLAELGAGLSWHLLISLPPDRAVIQIEARVFNRSWQGVLYNAGFVAHSASVALLSGARFASPGRLMPHQLDVWGAQIVPVTGSPAAVNEVGALSVGSEIEFQTTQPLTGKIFLQLNSGETFEAPFEVLPEALFKSPSPGDVTAVVIRNEDGESVLEWRADAPEKPAVALPAELGDEEALFRQSIADETLRDVAEFDLRFRAPVKILRAISAMRKQDWLTATRHLDDALLTNSEDHLVWLMKAILARKQGGETEDLLNAHYLAPLEPLLRMESFLAQNIQTREKSPLVTPLAENPDALVEAACFLAELGLLDDFARWCDECLRHREVPMIRYLLADALLASSPMSVDAASHVAAAAKTPVNPPYPWRAREREVLARLQAKFPSDSRIQDLLALGTLGA
jgi:hypothetical protein